MSSSPSERRFSDAVLKPVSPDTRKSLEAFAAWIARAEADVMWTRMAETNAGEVNDQIRTCTH